MDHPSTLPPPGDDDADLPPGPAGCEAHVLALRMIAAATDDTPIDHLRLIAVRGLVRGWDDDPPT